VRAPQGFADIDRCIPAYFDVKPAQRIGEQSFR
jgi:hypothetical protein